MNNSLEIVGVRDALAEDKPFVIDAWLMSFRQSHFAGPISAKRYRDIYSVEISDLILRPQSHVRVAYNRENTGQIFGFLCFEEGHKFPVVHYLYVKKPFRLMGIAMMLMRDAGVNPNRRFLYTYRTPLAHDLTKIGGKFERGQFRPNIARFGAEDSGHV